MPKIDKIGRVSSQSVEKATGKSWDQWVQILEKAGARSWTRKDVVAFLKTKHKLGPWWQQGVTHGFEIHSGRRIDGQNSRGEYGVTVTRSVSCHVQSVWTCLVSKEGLAAWLTPMSDLEVAPKEEFEVEGGIHGDIRTLKAARRIRLAWNDSDWPKVSTVQVTLVDRPKQKCILVIQHEGLPNARVKEKMRGHWKSKTEDFMRVLKVEASSKAKRTAASRAR